MTAEGAVRAGQSDTAGSSGACGVCWPVSLREWIILEHTEAMIGLARQYADIRALMNGWMSHDVAWVMAACRLRSCVAPLS